MARRVKKAVKPTIVGLAGLVVVPAVTGWLSRDRIGIPPKHYGQYLKVRGEQIRYYQTGSGPDVLLIHGLPGLIEDWQPLLDAAARDYRLTAYDRPGHGFSAKSGEYTLAHNADVALSLIDELQLKDVIVVGHSYGGAVVLAMAARNPPKVRAFVCLGGVTRPHEKGFSVLDPIRLPLVGRGLAVVSSRIVGEGMVREGMTRAFSPNESRLTTEIMDERLSVFLQTKVIVAVAREEGAFNHDFQTLEPSFSVITKPLRFIHGRGDQLVPVADTVSFHERFPSTGLTVLEDTGHEVQFAHPEVVLSVIESLSR